MVAFIGLAAMAVLFLASTKPKEVTIAYGGMTKYQFDGVFFTLSNPFPGSVSCTTHVQAGTNRIDAIAAAFEFGKAITLRPHEQTNVYVKVPGNMVWQLVVNRPKMKPPSKMDHMRSRLANEAFTRGWVKLGRRIAPRNQTPTVYSPLMLGNKPAPVELK